MYRNVAALAPHFIEQQHTQLRSLRDQRRPRPAIECQHGFTYRSAAAFAVAAFARVRRISSINSTPSFGA
jgi:hypothetical protein